MSDILIVDDSALFRMALARHLTASGHRVSHAENGRIALAMLERTKVNLLLLDYRMPDMDGLQLLAALHATRHARVIIAYTASAPVAISSVETAMRVLGADDFVRIEGGAASLLARIDEVLQFNNRAPNGNSDSANSLRQTLPLESVAENVRFVVLSDDLNVLASDRSPRRIIHSFARLARENPSIRAAIYERTPSAWVKY